MSRPARKYMGGGLHVSASSLRVLQECPRQFFYQYLQGRPRESVSSRMIIGTAIHAALEAFYRALMENREEPGLDELVEVAAASLRQAVAGPFPVAFDDGEDLEAMEAECNRVLTAFLDAPYRPHKVLGVEEPFGLALRDEDTGELLYDELVVGFFDLVAEDEDGTVAIVDHKVSSRLAVPKSTEQDVQLGLYAWAGDQIASGQVRLRHHVLVRGKKAVRAEIVDIPRSPSDSRETHEAICSGLEMIQVAVEHPRPDALLGRRRSWRCGGCGYRAACSTKVTTVGSHVRRVAKSS